jgi:hypothetical protein
VVLKFKGNIIFFNKLHSEKELPISIRAFEEQELGKYTFCKLVQLDIRLVQVIEAPLAGVGKEVNLTHWIDAQLENIWLKFVAKFILGTVIFFKDIQPLNIPLKLVQIFSEVGSVTDLKFLQIKKVLRKPVIPVLFEGKDISNRLVQF